MGEWWWRTHNLQQCQAKMAVIDRRIPLPSKGWWLGMFCCVFGVISNESSTLSCSTTCKLLFRTSTGRNWTVWRKQTGRSAQLQPKWKKCISFRLRKTKHISPETQEAWLESSYVKIKCSSFFFFANGFHEKSFMTLSSKI